jgi:hypothetical protein
MDGAGKAVLKGLPYCRKCLQRLQRVHRLNSCLCRKNFPPSWTVTQDPYREFALILPTRRTLRADSAASLLSSVRKLSSTDSDCVLIRRRCAISRHSNRFLEVRLIQQIQLSYPRSPQVSRLRLPYVRRQAIQAYCLLFLHAREPFLVIFGVRRVACEGLEYRSGEP